MTAEKWTAEIMEGLFLLLLCLSAWKDFRTRQVQTGLLCITGLTGILCRGVFCWLLWREGEPWAWPAWDALRALLVGAALLAVSRATKGALGAGDGWFFAACAPWLGLEKSFWLLMGGMTLCFIFCAMAVLWGVLKGISMKNKKIPFLPFLVPAALLLLK